MHARKSLTPLAVAMPPEGSCVVVDAAEVDVGALVVAAFDDPLLEQAASPTTATTRTGTTRTGSRRNFSIQNQITSECARQPLLVSRDPGSAAPRHCRRLERRRVPHHA